MTPDGTRLYVTHSGSSEVSIIDTATRTVVGSIAVGAPTTRITIMPDGKRAYVTSQSASTVQVIDLATDLLVGPPITVNGASDVSFGPAILVPAPTPFTVSSLADFTNADITGPVIFNGGTLRLGADPVSYTHLTLPTILRV